MRADRGKTKDKANIRVQLSVYRGSSPVLHITGILLVSQITGQPVKQLPYVILSGLRK